MARMSTGGAAVVQTLAAHGVTTVFGIPGTHNLEIYRYLPDSGIRHVAPRHEQGAGFAADGYARVSGGPGVLLTTSGPGLTNATTALATSHADRVPLLVLSPGPATGQDRADAGLLHEVKDQRAHLDAVVDRSIRVPSAAHAQRALSEIFLRWRQGHSRPVHIEIPIDVLEGEWQQTSVPAAAQTPRPVPAEAALRDAARLLSGARAPLIVAGGGSTGAGPQLRTVADTLDAPVVTTANGKGVLAEDHPLAVGSAAAHLPVREAIDAADAVLVVGSELAETDFWHGSPSPSGTVVRIDIDAAQLHKNLVADQPLLGDAQVTLRALAARLGASQGTGGRERAEELRTSCAAAAQPEGQRWRGVHELLRTCLPRDAVIAGDSAQVSYNGTLNYWPAAGPHSFLYPAGYAPLGYGVPAAIGAALAAPDRAVAVLCGDGGLLFSVQEIATAAELRLPLPIVVMNNSGYGQIREEMSQRGIAPVGVNGPAVDLVLLAKALGGHGVRSAEPEALPKLVTAALSAPGPTLIELVVP